MATMAATSLPAAGRHEHVRASSSPPIAAAEAATINRVLQCIAAFYDSDVDAHLAAHKLRHEHGLRAAQLLVLGPSDAAAGRFARLSRQWSGTGQASDLPLLADRWIAGGLGALLGSLLGSAWLLIDPTLTAEDQVLLLALAVLWGTVIGAGLSMLWHRPPRPRRFNGSVQRHLADGNWAVVAHDVPWSSQGDVLTLLRGSGLKWCAVAQPTHRI